MIGFCLGVMSFSLLPVVLYQYWWGFPAFMLVQVSVCHFVNNRMLKKCRLTIPFVMGLSLSAIFAVWGNHHLIPHSLEKQDLHVEGVVSGLPIKQGSRCRFDLVVDAVTATKTVDENLGSDLQQWQPRVIQLNHYQCEDRTYAGQQLQLTVRLKQPHGLANNGGFDFERSWFSQKIDARGYVRSVEQISDASRFFDLGVADRWRFDLAAKIDATELNDTAKPILKAILLGDKRGLDQQAWQVLRNTGTVHLLIISGLHIGLVSGFVVLLVCGVGRFIPSISIQKRRKTAVYAALVCAVVYAVMAGFTLPTQRALVMTTIVLLSWLSIKQYSVIQRLSFAAAVVLIIDPLAFLSAGFWLSFSATAMLLYLLNGQTQQTHWLLSLFKLQFGLFVISVPLLAFWFYQVPLVSTVFNLFAVPLVSFFLLPFSLLSLVIWLAVGDIWFLSLSAECWALFWHYLTQAEDWLSYQWFVGQPTVWVAVLALIGSLWLLAPRPIPGRYLGMVFWLPILFAPKEMLSQNSFSLSVIDVGQGLSVLVRTANHQLLYDTGASFDDFSIASISVVPFLLSQHIQTLDKLIISHGDNDHRGGLVVIKNAFDVEEIIESSDELSGCRAGQYWVWDGVTFEFLHPESELPSKSNNQSCVLKISNTNVSALLAGDIESDVESTLIAKDIETLDVDVLLVPHHGSKTSSRLDFLNAVTPSIAVNSAGYLNRYHHPHPTIEKRYKELGIEFYNTANEGQISVQFNEKGEIDVSTFRSVYSSFWRR